MKLVTASQGQESTTFRLVAKFLNSHNLSGPCREVLIHAGVTLEHPSVSTLRASVLAGDWNVAEKALASCASNGLLDDIVYSDPPTLSWKLRGHSSHARKNGPSARTMHQLVLDSQSHCLYLLGGWSDTSFKRDFFQYNLETDHWTTLSTDVAYNGGPVTLVLHRMLWAADEGALYLVVPVFGQDIQKDGFLDHSNLSPELMTDWAHGFKRPLDYVKVDGFAVYRWDPAAPQQWKLITTLFPVGLLTFQELCCLITRPSSRLSKRSTTLRRGRRSFASQGSSTWFFILLHAPSTFAYRPPMSTTRTSLLRSRLCSKRLASPSKLG